MLKGELVKMKRKLGERKAKWQEERMKMVDRIKVLEEEVKGWEIKEGRVKEGLERKRGRKRVEDKLRDIKSN